MNVSFLRQFLKTETASGVFLLIATMAALLIANSPLSAAYYAFFYNPFPLCFGNLTASHSLQFWINEGLMTLFFVMVVLELKREFFQGKEVNLSNVMLPAVAALGGMVVPGLIYLLVNFSHPETLKGWTIPVATDIAFALATLSLFGKRIPVELKLFLMALAIFDDVGAIIIIAIFHTKNMSLISCLLSLFTLSLLFIFNYLGVTRLTIYLVVGLILWILFLNSGMHATIAGVLFACFIPANQTRKLELILHPWVAFLITPLFAFANAGFSLQGLTFSTVVDYVTLGIILGLVIGKPLGVFGSTWILVKAKLAKLPASITWFELFGMSILCGIGFTMSLFLGTLAFEHQPFYLTQVRIGVLLGSFASGLLGTLVLLAALQGRRKFETKS